MSAPPLRQAKVIVARAERLPHIQSHHDKASKR
nr:MAG TPA: hypothetical protein [Caudoviricetes sp.]